MKSFFSRRKQVCMAFRVHLRNCFCPIMRASVGNSNGHLHRFDRLPACLCGVIRSSTWFYTEMSQVAPLDDDRFAHISIWKKNVVVSESCLSAVAVPYLDALQRVCSSKLELLAVKLAVVPKSASDGGYKTVSQRSFGSFPLTPRFDSQSPASAPADRPVVFL